MTEFNQLKWQWHTWKNKTTLCYQRSCNLTHVFSNMISCHQQMSRIISGRQITWSKAPSRGGGRKNSLAVVCTPSDCNCIKYHYLFPSMFITDTSKLIWVCGAYAIFYKSKNHFKLYFSPVFPWTILFELIEADWYISKLSYHWFR